MASLPGMPAEGPVLPGPEHPLGDEPPGGVAVGADVRGLHGEMAVGVAVPSSMAGVAPQPGLTSIGGVGVPPPGISGLDGSAPALLASTPPLTAAASWQQSELFDVALACCVGGTSQGDTVAHCSLERRLDHPYAHPWIDVAPLLLLPPLTHQPSALPQTTCESTSPRAIRRLRRRRVTSCPNARTSHPARFCSTLMQVATRCPPGRSPAWKTCCTTL